MMGVNSRKHYFTTNNKQQQITDNYNGKQNKTKNQ